MSTAWPFAVSPEGAIEYVVRQGRLAGLSKDVASVYVDYGLFSLSVKRFSTSTHMTFFSIARSLVGASIGKWLLRGWAC